MPPKAFARTFGACERDLISHWARH